ncbi:MAG: aldo/keto reductase [Thermoplasmata archaeon]
MTLSGRATPGATRQFRDRAVSARAIAFEHFREAPGGLVLSSLGLGTYIGAPDGPTDFAVEQAVTVSLASSRVNVLDTASNYRHQRAERSIGRALARLAAKGEVPREAVFVATKNGYFAPDGESRVPTDRWVAEELIRPGILDPADVADGCHAMSRSYLLDQFERSRTNLGLTTIDLLYLHNAPDAQIPAVGREAFVGRLEEAFGVYEGLRDRGQLGAYGIATWDSLRSPRADPAHFSLETAVRLARKVGGEGHGFRFVQFPFNLAMPEAATLANQSVGGTHEPLFAAASKLGIACFTSVPLMQGHLARTGPKRTGLSSAQTALQFARSAPGALSALVGQKDPNHLSENLDVAVRRPWDRATFDAMLR